MAAPSAGNEQPWHFIVIDDRDLMASIQKVHPFSRMLDEAPLAIMVCGDTSMERHLGFWVQDCAAATENLLLAAHSMGLGAVWIGVHPHEDREMAIRRLFCLPDGIIPLSIVALGHPAESKEPSNRFMAERMHYNLDW